MSSSQTIQAIAAASGYSNSAIASATYTINLPVTLPVVATPAFSPSAGTFNDSQSVTITDATPGAAIYYTSDGATPTTASALYSGPITVSRSETLQAVAVASGYSQSAIASAAYTISIPAASTPVISPASGTYTAAQTVSISDATPGAAIYYTPDGTTPTSNSILYTSPITMSRSGTLQAIATASGYSQSAIGSAVYTINIPAVSAPLIAPGSGTYTTTQTVTITVATPGAVIYYTTNGTAPTPASTLYTGPITVSASESFKRSQ